MKNKETFSWTKEDIKKVMEVWTAKSNTEIAESIGHGCDAQKVSYIAGQIRKEGGDLPKKRVIGNARNLIREVLSELA